MCDKQSLSISGALSNTGFPIFCSCSMSRTDSLDPPEFCECRGSSLTPKVQSVECHSATGRLSIICRSHRLRGQNFESFLTAIRVIGFAVEGMRIGRIANEWRVGEIARDIHRQRYHLCDRKNIQNNEIRIIFSAFWVGQVNVRSLNVYENLPIDRVLL